MTVMTPIQQRRLEWRRWFEKSFPWCDYCKAHGSGSLVCHWCERSKA